LEAPAANSLMGLFGLRLSLCNRHPGWLIQKRYQIWGQPLVHLRSPHTCRIGQRKLFSLSKFYNNLNDSPQRSSL
jgi:hypothetical protein